MERTTEENKELRFIAAKEKLEVAILFMREASLLTKRNVDFEILNTILETFDGCTNIGLPANIKDSAVTSTNKQSTKCQHSNFETKQVMDMRFNVCSDCGYQWKC